MAEDPEVELLFSLTGTLALFAQRRFMDQVGRRHIIHHPAPPEKLIGFICARVITQAQRENPFIDQNKLELSPLACDIKALQASSLHFLFSSYLITFPAEVTRLQHSEYLLCMLRKGLKLIRDLLVCTCSHGNGSIKHWA